MPKPPPPPPSPPPPPPPPTPPPPPAPPPPPSRLRPDAAFAAPSPGGRGPSLRIFAALLFLCATLLAQDQPFTSNIGTRLVTQTVTVTGKDGKPVEGLT